MKGILKRFEQSILQNLLIRFIIRQIDKTTWKSSELVDCATAIIDEVKR